MASRAARHDPVDLDADLLIHHAALATLRGAGGAGGAAGARPADAAQDVGLVPDGAVAVRDGRVAWVGPSSEWDGRAARTIDAGGRLVTPGYVDAHTHLVYAGDRAFELPLRLAGKSYLDVLAAGGGIAYTTRMTRAASLDDLVAQARPRLERMLAAGTTALEAKTGYALETAGELRMLAAADRLARESGVPMAHTFLGAHAVPAEHKARPDRYVDEVVDAMLPAVKAQGIASFVDVFVEEGVFTLEQGERILTAARRLGFGLRLHADEIHDLGGAALAARLGCVSADHLLAVSPEGIAALAEAGTVAVLLPTVPITLLAPTWAPGRAMLAAGVPVALATDHNPNNPVVDLTLAAQLGTYLLGLSPEQALTAVTWNAACANGQQHEVGSLAVGKRADLLLHEVRDVLHWAHEPGRRTVAAVVRGAGGPPAAPPAPAPAPSARPAGGLRRTQG